MHQKSTSMRKILLRTQNNLVYYLIINICWSRYFWNIAIPTLSSKYSSRWIRYICQPSFSELIFWNIGVDKYRKLYDLSTQNVCIRITAHFVHIYIYICTKFAVIYIYIYICTKFAVIRIHTFWVDRSYNLRYLSTLMFQKKLFYFYFHNWHIYIYIYIYVSYENKGWEKVLYPATTMLATMYYRVIYCPHQQIVIM